MATLQVFKSGDLVDTVFLSGSRVVLGRHPECDVVLDAAAVSRQHAQIVTEGDACYLEDLHSRNGTFLNGKLVKERRVLHEADRIKICDLELTFHHGRPNDQSSPRLLLDEDSQAGFSLDDSDSPVSSITGKLSVSSSRGGLHLAANAETKLRVMMEIAHALGRAVSVQEVLGKVLDSLFKIFMQADRGFVVLRAPDGKLLPAALKFRREKAEESIRVSRTIIEQAMETREALLSADAGADRRFAGSQSVVDLRIRSMMCVPLVDADGASLGAIQVDTLDQRYRFGHEDLDLLASIAEQTAVALSNAQLHERILGQKALERDLELAHRVQRGLLPAAPPRIEGYHFFDFYEPARHIGGDYYDYLFLPDGRLALVLGDVSGKGIAAALLMAKLSGEVKFYLASEPFPAQATRRINASFARSGWDDRFVTFVLAVLEPRRHVVTLVNAGHMAPLLRRASGQVQAVGDQEAGLPLGVDPDFEYLDSTISLEPGDSLTFFTDGISEAMNLTGELYGLARLRKQVAASGGQVATLGRQILDDVRRFVGGEPQSDDMCLACLGRAADG